MRWKTFAVLCNKFIQDTIYQFLSESEELCRRYDKNILACFFLEHGVYMHLTGYGASLLLKVVATIAPQYSNLR